MGAEDTIPVHMHSQSEIPNTLLFFHTTSVILLHSAQQCSDKQTGSKQTVHTGKKFTFFLLTQATKVDPLFLQVGSEEGGHCYSVADKIKRPSHPPAALPAMLHTLKVI